MRLLLLGKNGQVGFALQRALAPLGLVTALDRAACDLADAHALRCTLRRTRPDVIINAAACTAVDRAESTASVRAQACAVNGTAPGIIGEEAVALGALVVHYGTDYVFDGAQSGRYRESDHPRPLNVYGAGKLAGERALQASGARHVILRTSWVVGTHGRNFAQTVLRLAAERTQLDVVADQVGAPTSAALIADVTAHILRILAAAPPQSALLGLYHLSAAGQTTWHAYARHVVGRARRAGYATMLAPDAIRPIAARDYPTAAPRPANSLLDTHKLRTTFGLDLPDWCVGVDRVVDDWLAHAMGAPTATPCASPSPSSPS